MTRTGTMAQAVETRKRLHSLFLAEDNLALATDLYQLTMAAAYFENNCRQTSTFELFVRKLPRGRSFLVAAGLEQALHYLSALRFSPEAIKYLRGHPVFKNVSQAFFDYLAGFRFAGEVWAMPEGTIAFAEEPLLRVTAPVIEAQLVETYLLSTINFQTSIASKATRMYLAARGRAVIEFGTRRAHGAQAAVMAARAAYIGGCLGTSNVLAGYEMGIPIYGTMAHSFVMAFPDEVEAFRSYQRAFPESTVLLVDTYDSIAAVKRAIDMGVPFQGIRLDSGDLIMLSRRARELLDSAGLNQVKVVASGDLNEKIIAKLTAEGAPIDIFGVGTELSTSRDQPALGGIYKLVEQREDSRRVPKAKYSEKKATYPGGKQVYRLLAPDGSFSGDIIALSDEPPPEGAVPLLIKVMEGGRPVVDLPELAESRARTIEQLSRLPEPYKRLEGAARYPVKKSARLNRLRRRTVRILRPPASPVGKG